MKCAHVFHSTQIEQRSHDKRTIIYHISNTSVQSNGLVCTLLVNGRVLAAASPSKIGLIASLSAYELEQIRVCRTSAWGALPWLRRQEVKHERPAAHESADRSLVVLDLQ